MSHLGGNKRRAPKPLSGASPEQSEAAMNDAVDNLRELQTLARLAPEAATVLLAVMGTLSASVELARKSVALDEAKLAVAQRERYELLNHEALETLSDASEAHEQAERFEHGMFNIFDEGGNRL